MVTSQANTAQVIPFEYRGGIRLREACWMDDKPWFTRRAIGEWLGYIRPQEQVDRLILRHPYIEEGAWATHVNLGCVEGGRRVVRKVRVYNPVGLYLITFESHTAKALRFKVAVAHLVEAFSRGELRPKRSYPRPDWERRVMQLDEILALRDPHERSAAVEYMAEQLGRSPRTVYRRLRNLRCVSDPITPRYGVSKGFRMPLEERRIVEAALREDPSLPPRRLQELVGGPPPSKRTLHRFKLAFLKEEARHRAVTRLRAIQ